MPPSLSECVDHYKCMRAVFCRLQTLFESGMLDATETSALSHPVEAAERRLELLGPVWRAPSVLEVLRQLPFMRGQPQSMLEFFLRSVAAPGQRGTTWAGPRRSAWQTSQSNSLGGARRVERELRTRRLFVKHAVATGLAVIPMHHICAKCPERPPLYCSYSQSYSIWHGKAVQPTREPAAHG